MRELVKTNKIRYDETKKSNLIGEGFYGKVFLYSDDTFGLIAMKEILKEGDGKVQFENEVNLKELYHSNIIKLYDFQEFDDCYRIFMKYYPNGSLFSYLKKKSNTRLTFKQILKFYKDICKGVQYLHINNYLHRDLSSSNVLISEHSQAIISDGGFIKKLNHNKNNDENKSFYNYLYCPVDKEFGKYSDIFYLSVLFYEIYEGIRPFEDLSPEEIRTKITKGEKLKFSSECNDKLKELIEQCWEQDYKKRPTIEEILNSLEIITNSFSKKTPNFPIQSEFVCYSRVERFGKLYSYSKNPNCEFNINLFNKEFSETFNYFLEKKDGIEYYDLNDLGLCYFDGLGTEQDYYLAFHYIEKAAKNNNEVAQRNLGYLYLKGYGIKKDFDKAFYWFLESSKNKYNFGYLNLGDCYYYGIGIAKNDSKAFLCYYLSSLDSNSYALNMLGLMFSKGYSVKKNHKFAEYFFQLSQKLNNSFSYINEGELKIEKNQIKEGIDSLHFSALQGDKYAKQKIISLLSL